MYKIKTIINPIIPVPTPNNIGVTIPCRFFNISVKITKIKRANSNSFGKLIFTDFFNIWGVKSKNNRNIFVDAICQYWLCTAFIIERISINLIKIEM
jgi:hypothetical protein